MRTLSVTVETWPIAGAFRIARGEKSEARVIVATIEEDGRKGRGECVPYVRYGESVEGVAAAITACADMISGGAGPAELCRSLPAGSARNALDCALWDLTAKLSGKPVWELLGLFAPEPKITAFTLSVDTPEAMEKAARAAGARPLLKVKLAGDGDGERIAAVRRAAPHATLIVDANESWRTDNLAANLKACLSAGVKLIEQPLPRGEDDPLRAIGPNMRQGLLFCADESAHTACDLPSLEGAYQAVNIKLDKAGGLTEALAMAKEALARGFAVMVGSMVGTSLAMAPAMLLAGMADFVDLDGPLLLARDRSPGLAYEGSLVFPPPPELWG